MTAGTGVGSSTSNEAGHAGREAALEAVAGLRGQECALVIVFASICYDLAELLHAIRGVTGDAPLVGASSAGLLVTGDLVPVGGGVVVTVLAAGDHRFATGSVSGLAGREQEAGRELARSLRETAGEAPHAGVLLFSDGLSGDPQELVRGIYRVTGAAVPLVGAAAADDRTVRQTFVFRDDEVLADSAVGVWISSPRPVVVGSAHGWTPVGEAVLVSRARGRELADLGGRPAGRVYEELLGSDACRLGDERFSKVALLHPLGLVQPDGSVAVRSLLAADPDAGLVSFAPVPEASVVHVMSGTPEGLLDAAVAVVQETLGRVREPCLMLAFSCVARYDALGTAVADEAKTVQHAAGDVPTVGFYTYGEFARTSGVMGYHNATLTLLVL